RSKRDWSSDVCSSDLLLIAEPGPDGRLIDVDRRMHIVRLGEDVDATGRLAPAAIERTRAALAEYAEAMVAAGVEKVRMAATSARSEERRVGKGRRRGG